MKNKKGVKKKNKDTSKILRLKKKPKTSKKIIKSTKKNIKTKKNTIKKTSKIHKKIKKSKLEKRAATKIPHFDRLIGGGFERNSINLIAGGSGSGKSIFALQFLLEGIKNGEKTLYVSFEEKKEEFYKNMKQLGWDLDKLEKSNKFIFLEYSPEKVKMMLDEGGGAIESIILKNETKRIVIDSITSFSLLFEDEFSRRQSTLELFDVITKWNCTTLLTVQYDPLAKKYKGLSSIEFEADSIILLYYVTIKSRRKRFIEIIKMRGTDHSKDIHIFHIKKKGIRIGRKAKINKINLQI